MSRPTAPIVLLTDFGAGDWYAGVLKGVLLERAPGATLVDLSHAVPPGDVRTGAFVLENAWRWFPSGSVFLVVVDPGVGTKRRPLAVRAEERFFVGPDNGVLTPAIAVAGAEVRRIDPAAVPVESVSPTFHGRDLFAPAAALLHGGTALDSLGPEVTDPARLGPEALLVSQHRLVGHIIYVDRFGNCISDIPGDALLSFLAEGEAAPRVSVGSLVIEGLVLAYGEAGEAEACALIGSSGRLEIALRGGDARQRFGLAVGQTVEVQRGGS